MVTVPTVVEKRCTKCRVLKQSTDFFKFKFSSDGLQSYCKVGRVLPQQLSPEAFAGCRFESLSFYCLQIILSGLHFFTAWPMQVCKNASRAKQAALAAHKKEMAQAVNTADLMQQQMPGMAMQQLGMDSNAAMYTSTQFSGGDPSAIFDAALAFIRPQAQDQRQGAVIAGILVSNRLGCK